MLLMRYLWKKEKLNTIDNNIFFKMLKGRRMEKNLKEVQKNEEKKNKKRKG